MLIYQLLYVMSPHFFPAKEIVNLIVTGKAVSNVFDGVMELDSGGTTKVCKIQGNIKSFLSHATGKPYTNNQTQCWSVKLMMLGG